MIKSIFLSNVANFGNEPQEIDKLYKVNFIYGPNRSGKTTITRVIANENKADFNCKDCEIRWKDETPIETMVYNSDFVKDNFNSSELKGIFTVGKSEIGTQEKIREIKEKISQLEEEIKSRKATLEGEDGKGGKRGELSALEYRFKEKCWVQKQRYDQTLKGGFIGCRDSKEKFKERVLYEYRDNTAELCTLKYLEEQHSSIFSSELKHEGYVQATDFSVLIKYESDPILEKSVIGKRDVDIAALIEKLGNSDWVRQGRRFFEGNICPFCQQRTEESFAKSLEDYFDETFINDTEAIKKLRISYGAEAGRVQRQIAEIFESDPPYRFLNTEQLKTKQQQLDSKIKVNQQLLEIKEKETSRSIELESLSDIADEIKTLIDEANKSANDYNAKINNLINVQRTLIAEIWRFVVEQLKIDIQDYEERKGDLDKAISGLVGKIDQTNKDKKSKEAELADLEKQTTDIQPTINAINALLKLYKFTDFSLDKASETSYKLIRDGGGNAKSTLSEGERNFITFLYFYHLLKGSTSESGMTRDCIVVIDDPVSSLDSDTLFVVSNLIKELFKEVRSDNHHIKQILVLTHNVYFHSEVTFNPRRSGSGQALKDETFWAIRKIDDGPELKNYESNPIKSSYKLLWSEVRKARESDKPTVTIQNTLRRILESYFGILGSIDLSTIIKKFEGVEQVICNSLFSWMNASSHNVYEDIDMNDNYTIKNHLDVFKEIFNKTGHSAHYEMMISDPKTSNGN